MGTFPQSEGGQVCKTIVTSAIQGPIAPVLDNLHAQTEKKKISQKQPLSAPAPPLSLSLSYLITGSEGLQDGNATE